MKSWIRMVIWLFTLYHFPGLLFSLLKTDFMPSRKKYFWYSGHKFPLCHRINPWCWRPQVKFIDCLTTALISQWSGVKKTEAGNTNPWYSGSKLGYSVSSKPWRKKHINSNPFQLGKVPYLSLCTAMRWWHRRMWQMLATRSMDSPSDDSCRQVRKHLRWPGESSIRIHSSRIPDRPCGSNPSQNSVYTSFLEQTRNKSLCQMVEEHVWPTT